MLNSISIDNFRGISHIEFEELKQFNLFVGKNNCGKTTILESVFLLINPSNVTNTLKINGFRELIRIDDISWLSFFKDLDSENKITIKAKNYPTEIRELIIEPNKSLFPIDQSKNNDIVFPKNIQSSNHSLLSGLNILYHISNGIDKDFSMSIFTGPTGIQIKGAPKDYKEQLNGCWINDSNSRAGVAERLNSIQFRKETPRVIKFLKKIEPNIENIQLGLDGFVFVDNGMKTLMPLNLMGEGIIKNLSIILSILDFENGIICIDEIENGLHYTVLEYLWDMIFKTAKEFNVQIFASSHSYECVRAMNSSYKKNYNGNDNNTEDNLRVFRIERKNDTFKQISYTSKDLNEAIEGDFEVR